MNGKTVLLLLGGAFLLPSFQAEPSAEIRTKSLVIVDPQNRPRIVAEASSEPRLVFKSESGQDLIRLALGGDSDSFPFSQEKVPHLTLETGGTVLTLAVLPAPHGKVFDKEFLVESASLSMSSSQGKGESSMGKLLDISVFPNKAFFAIDSLSPESDPFEAEVEIYVDPDGKVTTNLGAAEDR
jgi:hypothetical protein